MHLTSVSYLLIVKFTICRYPRSTDCKSNLKIKIKKSSFIININLTTISCKIHNVATKAESFLKIDKTVLSFTLKVIRNNVYKYNTIISVFIVNDIMENYHRL